jgi:SAM-dependent methyltransferase
MLKTWLTHPLTRGLDLDDPHTTCLRWQIIREKPFLRKIYEEWYEAIAWALPKSNGVIVELGSGGGFLSDFIPGLITSEVFMCPGVSAVLDALRLPFGDASLGAIVMTNVFHHLSQPGRFFSEAERCIKPGGTIVMIEPWVTGWSRFVYRWLHHEPFQPEAATWEFPSTGPLSGANGALPWIVFERDRARFQEEFPQWYIWRIKPMMPFRYLVSGGVSMRSLMPEWSFGCWRWLENRIKPWMAHLGMFAQIILQKKKPQ